MKSWSHLLILLGLSSGVVIASLPLALRAAADPRPFPIDGFAAAADPTSGKYLGNQDAAQHLSYVEYNVTLSTGEASTWCWAWAEKDDFELHDIPTTACEADPTIKWSFIGQSDGSFNFTVSWQYTGHGHLVGSWIVPRDQIEWINQPGLMGGQAYVGPTSFTIPTKDVFG